MNRELRAGMKFVDPWPATFYCAGVDHGGCATAIDLRTPDGALWWADRRHLRPDTDPPVHPRFADWADDYVRVLREDLEDEGIDPDGTPEDARLVREASQRHGCRDVAVVAGVVATVVLIAYAVVRWAIT